MSCKLVFCNFGPAEVGGYCKVHADVLGIPRPEQGASGRMQATQADTQLAQPIASTALVAVSGEHVTGLRWAVCWQAGLKYTLIAGESWVCRVCRRVLACTGLSPARLRNFQEYRRRQEEAERAEQDVADAKRLQESFAVQRAEAYEKADEKAAGKRKAAEAARDDAKKKIARYTEIRNKASHAIEVAGTEAALEKKAIDNAIASEEAAIFGGGDELSQLD